MKKRIVQFLCFALFLMVLPFTKIVAQNPTAQLTYNNATQTVTATCSNLFLPMSQIDYVWKDQSNTILNSGTIISNNPTQIITQVLPLSTTYVLFEANVKPIPNPNEISYPISALLSLDIIIDDIIVFRTLMENCNSICPSPGTYQWKTYTREESKPTKLNSNKDANTLINEQICKCLKLNCQELKTLSSVSKNAFGYSSAQKKLCEIEKTFSACFENPSNQVYSKQNLINCSSPMITKSSNTAYPNPFDQQLTFEFTTENEGDVQIQLFDAMGRIVIQQKETLPSGGGQRIELSTDNLQQGIYYYRLLLNGELHTSGKVVK